MTLPRPSYASFALVTGASQGIGHALAQVLARMGHNVLLVARREEVLEELAAELQRRHHVRTQVYACDLGDVQQRQAFLEFLAEQDIHIAVNAAGIASFGPFASQDWDYETQQFSLNAAAVFEITHAVLPAMLRRGEGAICNVGSAAGNVPIPNNATYVFSKAGVNAFTEALHYELKDTGVHCTLLAPGPVREAHQPQAAQSKIDAVVPDFLWTDYESCAEATIAALAANKRRVVPGVLGKVMNGISAMAPTRVLAPVMGKFYAKLGS